MRLRADSRGFTLVEMLVVVPITLIVCVVMVSLLITKNGELYERSSRVSLRMEGLNILGRLQEELTFSNSFNAGLISDLSDPNAPSGGWKFNTTPSNTLIISLPAVDKQRSDPTRGFVFYTSGPKAGELAINNIIYYTSGTKLYRRVVIPDPTKVSPTNYYKKTCPPGDITPSCQDDLEMTTHLKSLIATYYDANNVAVNSNPTLADKIKVTLNMHDTANGNSIDVAVSITVKKYGEGL